MFKSENVEKETETCIEWRDLYLKAVLYFRLKKGLNFFSGTS